MGDFKEDITKLFNFVAQIEKVIVGGDFNSHHTAIVNVTGKANFL